MSPKPSASGTTNGANPPSEGDWVRALREFDESGNVSGLLEARTALVDALVIEAYHACLAPQFGHDTAVAAIAGYGRRELFPCSDVDLLILIADPNLRAPQRDALTAFLQRLWDTGLRPSHSVRTAADCCELHEDNIELHISLLDRRLLAGRAGLYTDFEAGLQRFYKSRRDPLLRGLCALARARHAKHQNLIYHLEPDIKEAPGGLRDYQLTVWARQLRPDAQRPDLAAAREFLFAARAYLHLRAGRDSNILTFDMQEEISPAGPAQWMREYFRHARDVHRAALKTAEEVEERSSSLLVQFRDWRSRVSNAEFFVSRERVYVRTPGQLDHDTQLLLRLFQFVARHGLKLSADTERRIAEALPKLRLHHDAAPLWPALAEIASLPNAALAFRLMHETGVLALLLPEWERIESLVVRDFYHRYTVDEHTLVALQQLEDLRESEDPARQGFRELLAGIDNAAPLVAALLLHDTGKAARTGKHAAESLLLARGALERFGAPEDVQEMVRFLIASHLDLSSAMKSRDLADPATGRWIADRAGTLEKLRNLTLLTYADISAVNPGAMTPWRLEQLWRAYIAGHNELTRELAAERIHAPADEFLEGFPVRYLRTHTEAEIAKHIEMERRAAVKGVAVDIERRDGTCRLTLIARDRPALLASAAAALASFGMNILKAEGFSNARGTVLDTFVFADPHRTLELNPGEADRLRLMLERVALGKLDVKSLLRNRPIPAPPSRSGRIPPRVRFDGVLSEAATLIHVSAEDRPGLLYDVASALSNAGCNIELVLIDTEAHRAVDVFYVTAGGEKVRPERLPALERLLLEAVVSGSR